MYSAVFGFVYKSAIGIVALLSSSLLAWAGVNSANDSVAPAMLDRVRVSYAVLPVVFLGGAILVMWRYPLTRARVEAIQAELALRKATTEAAEGEVEAARA
jgi:Na+/melibiose symporter-like transporter